LVIDLFLTVNSTNGVLARSKKKPTTESYVRHPTAISCHVGGNDIEVDSKGVVPPSLSLEIYSRHIPLHGRYVFVCHDCSTFFPTSNSEEIKKLNTKAYQKDKKILPENTS
jgi:hypothetical protein